MSAHAQPEDVSIKSSQVVDIEMGEKEPVKALPGPNVIEALLGPTLHASDGTIMPTLDVLAPQKNPPTYIGLYFSAKYCPHCREFTPLLADAYERLRNRENGMEIVWVSNDRTEETFDEYRAKMPWPVVTYNTVQTVRLALRAAYHIPTIPRLVVIDATDGKIVTPDARHNVVSDPLGLKAPWRQEVVGGAPGSNITGWDRLFSKPLFALGHEIPGLVSPHSPNLWMDENIVRSRAGILHLIGWCALVNAYFIQEKMFLYVMYAVVSWEFLFSLLFGLAPLAPLSFLGYLFVKAFGSPKPMWKPAAPKRFAWFLGLILVNTCLLAATYGPRELVYVAITMCISFTWAEAVLGFCLGCFIYNKVISKILGEEECDACH
jgi:thiol-disulfide isomerase/thioredoxin